MTKKIMLIAALALLFASCSTKKYDENITKAYVSSEICYAASGLIIDKTTRVWHNAIYNNTDSHGRYCSDFNSALYTLFTDYKEEDMFSTIDEYQEEMKTALAALSKAPKSRKEAYDDLLSIATDINMLCDLTKDPSGSLQSYREQTNELLFGLKKKLDAFELKYSGFLVESLMHETDNE